MRFGSDPTVIYLV